MVATQTRPKAADQTWAQQGRIQHGLYIYIYLRRCGTKASVILRHFPAVFTQFAYFSTGCHSTCSCVRSTFSSHSLKIATRFNQFPNPGGRGGTQVCKYYNSYYTALFISWIPAFWSRFLCVPWHFLHLSLPMSHGFYAISYDLYFLRFTLFSCIFPCFCSHFLCLPWFSIVSCIFLCFCSHFLCLPWHFTIYSSVVRRFPTYSHVFALISSACHDISCILTICSSVLR